MDAAAYYSDLTTQYVRYGGEAHAWHYGVWEPDVQTHAQALVRTSELLLRGLEVDAATHVLDIGFGSGGFAVWAASALGARVTGITVVPGHVALARALADQHGVGDRCDFRVMDMNAMQFEPARFDIVVNQETFCYAVDKAACLAAVHKVLRPGGYWRATDFSVAHEPRQPWQHEIYGAVCAGFHIPSIAPAPDVLRMLAQAGFEEVEARDLTPDTLETATRIIRITWLPRLADRCGLGWAFRPWDGSRRNRRGHVDAAYRYSRGLQRRFCRIAYYSARKSSHSPAQFVHTVGRKDELDVASAGHARAGRGDAAAAVPGAFATPAVPAGPAEVPRDRRGHRLPVPGAADQCTGRPDGDRR